MDRRVSLVPRNQVTENLTRPTYFCSDPFVSQSTQLLQHALAPASQSQEHIGDWSLASPNDGNTAIDFSLDSRIIPVRPVTPRYHLQVSLLQSPEGSGERVLVEDSQKEQLGQENGEQAGISLTSSKHDPVQLGSGSELFHLHGDNSVTACAGKVIGEPLFMSSRHPCFQMVTS